MKKLSVFVILFFLLVSLCLDALPSQEQKKELAELKLDKSLSTFAERALKEIIAGKTHSSLPLGDLMQVAFLSYITEDPTLLPKDLKERMEKDFIYYPCIGIGTTFKENKEFPRGAFWVTIFLER